MHKSAEELFAVALELTNPPERAALLDRECAGNPMLREEVGSLLAAHERASKFLENPPVAAAAETLAVTTGTIPVTEKPGDKIGRYKLLQMIGEGGCGVVYMAEQEEPVRRRVALKVIKLGMDTRQVIARFEAERQALALMDHPNIAKVLDAGATETGRPYFVMELVKGIKITDYCDQNNLSTRGRLDLFVQVCQAIQHAHQKGIIHRDIKPSNILVTLHDGVPVPKVIDFGIAKATTDQRLTDKTVFTAFNQFIGTPAYMSPEQAELSGLDIDTRGDIYSLGVLLYELLTGKTPFDARQLLEAGLDEMRRIIREVEPARPSTRLTTLTSEELTAVSKHRQSEPAKLTSLVRGDLDWIVMKCLEKDRTRRYETTNGLARDIERHLNNEPVTAAAPSAAYKFRKFARRNRAALATAGAIAALLVIGAGLSTWQAVRASRAERRARTEASRSRQVATFLTEMLQGVGPSVALGRDTTMLREILDKTAERLGRDLRNQPDVESNLRDTLGNTYDELGEYIKAEAMHRKALALRRRLLGKEHLDVAASLNNLAGTLQNQGKQAEAEAMFREALVIQKKLAGNEHSDATTSLYNLAIVLMRRGQLVEAEEIHREVLAMRRKLLGNEHVEVARSLNELGNVLWNRGRLAEAESMVRKALALQRKLLGNEHLEVARSLNNLAVMVRAQSKVAEAESMLREVLLMQRRLLGNEHPDVATALDNLANVLQEQGKLAEAEAMHRDALAMQKRLLGDEHPDVASSLNNLANVLRDHGELAEAEAMQRDALAMRKKLLGNEHPAVAGSLDNLGAVLLAQGKLPEAEAMFRDALAMRKRLPGNEHSAVAGSLEGLANVLQNQGKLAEAESMLREVLAMRKKLLGNEHPGVASSLHNLALVLRDQHNHAQAEAMLREALAMQRKLLGNEHPIVTESLINLADMLRSQSRLVEAESMYREVLTMRRKLLGNEHTDVALSLNNLAALLLKEGNTVEAEAMDREALAMLKKLLGKEHPDVALSLNNLAVTLQAQGKLAEAESLFREAIAIVKKLSAQGGGLLDLRFFILFGRGTPHFKHAAVSDFDPPFNNLLGLLVERSAIAAAEAVLRENAYVFYSLSGTNGDLVGPEGIINIPADLLQKDSPTKTIHLVARGWLLGRRGQWEAAARDFFAVIKFDAKSEFPAFALGALLVKTGDTSSYKAFRRRLLARFSFTEDPQTAAEVAMGLSLGSAESEYSPPSHLVEAMVTQDTNDVRQGYFQLVRALAEYRRGKFTSAEQWSRKSLAVRTAKPVTAVAAGAVQAMAQQQLKRPDEARKTLAEAIDLEQTRLPKLESGDLGEDWPEWLVAHILLREAKSVIEGGAHAADKLK